MQRILFVVATLLVTSVAPASQTEAGKGWHLTLTHQELGSEQEVELRMDDRRIRAAEAGLPQEVILGTEAMTVLDHGQKTYMVITYAQIEAFLGPMMSMMQNSAAKQRQALLDAMDDLPADERADVEQQINALDSQSGEMPELKLEATGEEQTIAGLPARSFHTLHEGKAMGEIWITDQISLAPITALVERFLPLVSQMQDGESERFWSTLEDLQGFPLRLVDLSEASPRVLLEVTEASLVDFSDADFSAPAEYSKSPISLDSLGGR